MIGYFDKEDSVLQRIIKIAGAGQLILPVILLLCAVVFTANAQSPAQAYRLVHNPAEIGGKMITEKSSAAADVAQASNLRSATTTFDIPASNRFPIIVSGGWAYLVFDEAIKSAITLIITAEGRQIGDPIFFPEGVPEKAGLGVWKLDNYIPGLNWEPNISVVVYSQLGIFRSDSRLRQGGSNANFGEIAGITPFVTQIGPNGYKRRLHYVSIATHSGQHVTVRLNFGHTLDPRAIAFDYDAEAMIIDFAADPKIAAEGMPYGGRIPLTITVDGKSDTGQVEVYYFPPQPPSPSVRELSNRSPLNRK